MHMEILSKKDWDSHTFQKIQLAGADLSSMNFEDCDFKDCEFMDCNLRNVSFDNCSFHNCNISNSNLHRSKMGEVLFTDCKLVGMDFSICKKLLFSMKLENCNLLMCNFSGLKLDEMSFSASVLKDSDFYEASLSGSDFSRCDLLGTLFENCDLEKADFRLATNYAIDPTKNKVKKAKFSMPEVLSFLAPLELDIE